MSGAGARPSALSDAGVRFDPESGELVGPGGATRLAPQPAELLALLLDEAGNVVSRSRIQERLWPGGRVEFDQGIAFAVREIRRALEQVGADGGLVETLPRRGFRVGAEAGDRGAPGGRRGLGWGSVAVGVLLGVLAGVTLVTVGSGGDGPASPTVALFPHEQEDGAPWGDPVSLAEALTARLTSDLAGDAGVIGPTGTAGLTGPNDTEGARAALGACLVLSGSLRSTGADSAVVFTQLVRTADRVHVWARWDTLRADEVVGTVAEAAVEPVRAALSGC